MSGNVLVTGACGQIGSELVTALRERQGSSNVIATDIAPPSPQLQESGPFEYLDVTDTDALRRLVVDHHVARVYHMAAVLSATGELDPQKAWRVNTVGLRNVLEAAREFQLERLYCPSSMAVFGPESPRHNTPQDTVLQPTTMYGITKVTGELLCNYYFHKYGVDVRGLRYPGIISSETSPGGGTTDYAVHIFYEAVKVQHYTCFVSKDTVLPMLYMPECISATLMLMDADLANLTHHADYNLGGISFSAGELAAEIAKHIPDFVCEYRPDHRQAYANSWPCSIDDSTARSDWGWRPQYDLHSMVADMLLRLKDRLDERQL
jgi:nucleoside-diphosphate-sugar epimerase